VATLRLHALEVVPDDPPAIRAHISARTVAEARSRGAEIYDAAGHWIGPTGTNRDKRAAEERVGAAVRRALEEFGGTPPRDGSVPAAVTAVADVLAGIEPPLGDGSSVRSRGCRICHSMGLWPGLCPGCPPRT
jgi:hypothetical protein